MPEEPFLPNAESRPFECQEVPPGTDMALSAQLKLQASEKPFFHITMTLRKASCSCGQLSARVSGEPIRVSICHCHACQRRTGSVFGAQARFARQAVEISGAGTEYVRVGDEGGRSTFSFCPVCGATVFYVMEGREDSIVIPVGAFAESSFPAPTFSVYEDRMHAWVTLPEDMEHMA